MTELLKMYTYMSQKKKKKKNDKEYCSAQGWSLEIILGLARNIK